jgi:hypothetical protein
LRELALADSQKIPVIPLLLVPELSIPPGFRYRLATHQYISATDMDAHWIGSLVQTLRYYQVVIPEERVTGSTTLRTTPKVGTGLMPYLADRDTQEGMIQESLEKHMSYMAHRPIVFVVHGAEAHCCDMFVERLAKDSIPVYLERIKKSNQLEWKSIRWPEHSQYAATAQLRGQLYSRTVLTRLELSLSALPQEMVRYIGTLRRPVLFSSILGNETWQPYEADLIAEVLRWWSIIPDVPIPSQPVVILLSVSYARHDPSLLDRLLGLRPESPIALQLRKLVSPDETAISVNVLPELTSLSRGDIEAWVRDIMQPNEVDEVLRVIRAIFVGRRKEAEQHIRNILSAKAGAMILDPLETVFRNRDRTGRLPMEVLAPLLKQLLRVDTVLRSL